jgi:hypothetical protein
LACDLSEHLVRAKGHRRDGGDSAVDVFCQATVKKKKKEKRDE